VVDHPAVPDEQRGLEVDGLSVRFGGIQAVADVSFSAPVGRITGLIGPNGAGKSTTFNACCGLAPIASGRIHFAGVDITRASTPARARLGLGRTFQKMEIYDSLTVAENVALGRAARLAGASPWRLALSTRAEQEETADLAAWALRTCGIEHLAGHGAGNLSTGQRRLVELARALAGRFRLLLLDEPSSGLDKSETALVGQVLRTAVAAEGLGVLIVEHDMDLVMDVCEHILVLDFGRIIFAGSPGEVRTSPEVRRAYLGQAVAS
jgi:ABC-type branched-subunit amino acid transport system ATPase component